MRNRAARRARRPRRRSTPMKRRCIQATVDGRHAGRGLCHGCDAAGGAHRAHLRGRTRGTVARITHRLARPARRTRRRTSRLGRSPEKARAFSRCAAHTAGAWRAPGHRRAQASAGRGAARAAAGVRRPLPGHAVRAARPWARLQAACSRSRRRRSWRARRGAPRFTTSRVRPSEHSRSTDGVQLLQAGGERARGLAGALRHGADLRAVLGQEGERSEVGLPQLRLAQHEGAGRVRREATAARQAFSTLGEADAIPFWSFHVMVPNTGLRVAIERLRAEEQVVLGLHDARGNGIAGGAVAGVLHVQRVGIHLVGHAVDGELA